MVSGVECSKRLFTFLARFLWQKSLPRRTDVLYLWSPLSWTTRKMRDKKNATTSQTSEQLSIPGSAGTKRDTEWWKMFAILPSRFQARWYQTKPATTITETTTKKYSSIKDDNTFLSMHLPISCAPVRLLNTGFFLPKWNRVLMAVVRLLSGLCSSFRGANKHTNKNTTRRQPFLSVRSVLTASHLT